MIRDLLKWVAPGLAVVLGGTTLCLAMTSADISTDLSERSAAAIAATADDWAEISLDARDLTLTGTTTDQALIDSAVTRLSGLPGIRSVTSNAVLAPLADPYIIRASLDQGAVSLSGAVPSEAARSRLLSLAGLDEGMLELRSGVPDRRAWLAGAEFALDQLDYLDQGEVTISDLTVNLTGRARSERAFRDLLIVMRAGPPAGVTLGDIDISPALVSPYRWNARFDGKKIEVSGYVPDENLAERYRMADVSGAPVATGLALASGEPDDFAALSQLLLTQLSRLEYGSASISDDESALTGAPPTLEIAQGIVETLEPSGTIVVLEPPRIADYWMSATRQPGGVVVFDGYVPDEATREDFARREGADTSYLKLGRGAPERYRSGTDFGLDALERMSEGRIALRDNVLTISGVARSGADYQALLELMKQQAPQGMVLARAEILAPAAASYNWTAAKESSGVITLSGLVPSASDEAALLSAAGPSAVAKLAYASGEPNGFVSSAATSIALLRWLREGAVSFEGGVWTVTGTANSPIDKAALEADFITRQLAGSGWSMAVAEPPPVIPEIAPYKWSATRTADGITLMGHVPAASLRSDLAVRGGDAVIDATELGSGAPAGFAADATAGFDAVLLLEEGEVSFDGTRWSLVGRAGSESARDSVLTTLASATDTGDWSIEITAPPPEPVATVPYTWSATKAADGAIAFDGLVSGEPLQRFLVVRAGGQVTDRSTVDTTGPASLADDQRAAIDALAVLSEGRASFDGTTWTIEGTLVSPEASVETALATASTPAANWVLALTSPPAIIAAAEPAQPEAVETTTPEAPPANPVPPQPELDETIPQAGTVSTADAAAPATADIAACDARVAEFSARNAILFQSGAALIAAESLPALDELALDLAACPDAIVHIEGHTDADGDDALNMALSVARAEAVVNALVERGVVATRLYAVGYGETEPVADNATAAGKRLNRRIVVTVEPRTD